ncbi:MAG: hypothetical protein KDB80_07885 [Planctomycetes bacterium]|nr:hypothetical protein [Planctomycetota bacterium]
MTLHRRRLRILGIAVIAIALAVTTRWIANARGTAPRIAWELDGHRAEPFAKVDALTPLACRLELDREAWVYAISFDMTRGSIALLPSTQLHSDAPTNPASVGSHRLPGRHLERNLSWHTGDAQGLVTFVVLVSDRQLSDLEVAMARMQQMGNGAFPQRPLLGTYAPKGGMTVVPDRHAPPTELLRDVCALQRFEHDGEMHEVRDGVHASVLRLEVGGRPDSAPLETRVRAELERDLGPVLGSPTPPK